MSYIQGLYIYWGYIIGIMEHGNYYMSYIGVIYTTKKANEDSSSSSALPSLSQSSNYVSIAANLG